MYRNDDKYEGEFVGSKKHGLGTYRYADSGELYVGQFQQDFREGEGEYSERNGNFYKGSWLRDLKHGEGKYCFKSGEIYQGDFR